MPGLERNDALSNLSELGREAAEFREEAGLTLEDVYDRTRIRLEYLRGIEEGNYEGFPEIVYIKGFVRTYLRVIGAPKDLLTDFMAQLDRWQPQRQEIASANILGNASQVPRGFKPVSHVWVFLVLLAALAGTGGYVWYAWSNGNFDMANLRWPIFTQGGPVSVDAQQETQDKPSSLDVAPVSKDLPPREEPKPQPQKKPSLAIQAQGDVWMRVTIGDTVVYSRTLKKGDSVEWELTAPARALFGRPNMVNVTLNGKDLGVPNPRGSKKAEAYIYQPDGTHRKAEGK